MAILDGCYEREVLEFDPTRPLANMGPFYRGTVPGQTNLLASNKFVSKDMSLEEAAKGFLKLGVKMIIEYNLAPFYRPDDPLEVPEIPDREIIKQFLDDK